MPNSSVVLVSVCATVLALATAGGAQMSKYTWSAQEQPIEKQLEGIRKLPDDVRAKTTRDLALEIRKLPPSANKVTLADWLAAMSTEGDIGGQETMQAVATTLTDAVKETPPPDDKGKPADEYTRLAKLVRYEHLQVNLNDPKFEAAMTELEANDEKRARAEFTLTDVKGTSWTLSQLRGKVVLVNFWATWCPPCRREMPDMDALYQQFKDQGFVVLAISDEKPEKVNAYLEKHPVSYPILLDPDRKVNEAMGVVGIPKSFLYNRDGQMVAEAIDMRTRAQFLEMLAKAGLQ